MRTLWLILADVSVNKIPVSSEYALASSVSTCRWSFKSSLLPASAIRIGWPYTHTNSHQKSTMGTPYRNSLAKTANQHNGKFFKSHRAVLQSQTNLTLKLFDPLFCPHKGTHVGDIINNNSRRGSAVVHGCETVIALLPGSPPNHSNPHERTIESATTL